VAVLIAIVCPGLQARGQTVETRDGRSHAFRTLVRQGEEAILVRFEGDARIALHLPLSEIVRVVPPPAEPGEIGQARERQLCIDFLTWIPEERRRNLLEEARSLVAGGRSSEALALLQALAERWPEKEPGAQDILELEGELAQALGWRDRVRELARLWCERATLVPGSIDSAWGWRRLGEQHWNNRQIAEAAWAVAPALAFAPDQARHLAECHALAAAAERRLGNRDAAKAIEQEALLRGLKPVDDPRYAPWHLGWSEVSPAQPEETIEPEEETHLPPAETPRTTVRRRLPPPQTSPR
jgi:tetratricopeptide (TPR) repeat protein